jgi:HK97 gp10 family phage protein
MTRVKTTMSVSGFKDLEKALAQLPKALAKSTVRKVLIDAMGPMAEAATNMAPVDTGQLSRTIIAKPGKPKVSSNAKAAFHTVLKSGGSKEAAVAALRAAKRADKGANTFSMVSLGVAGDRKAHWHLAEFGTTHSVPQPFIRPAFDEHKVSAIKFVGQELGPRIEMAAKRAAKNAANRARRESAKALRSA